MEATQVDIDPNEEIGFMNIDETGFSNFTLGKQIRHLEVEGYVVLPDVLDAELMEEIKAEMADAPMQTKDYSDAQTYCLEPQWRRPSAGQVDRTPSGDQIPGGPARDGYRVHPGAFYPHAVPARRPSLCIRTASHSAPPSSDTRGVRRACFAYSTTSTT